ncbi:MAG: hypothetical protein HWE39_20030 [Oceanospirillaceae bacterium]|nr:hypothetical protein [Oceanospirillaceae bacterium]
MNESEAVGCRLLPWLSPRTGPVAGWLLLLTAVCSVVVALTGLLPALVPGLLAWCAGLLLFRRIGRLQRIQVGVMLTVGLSGLVAAALEGAGPGHAIRAIGNSQGLISLLVAVGFLRLIALRDVTPDSTLPQGPRALWHTLLGTHLFGAAINFSALAIIGDRLHAIRPLLPTQAIVLSRGFGLASLWSPMFVAMALALTLAPGADLLPISLAGLAVAIPALLLTGMRLARRDDSATFAGYPMRMEALRLPLLLVLIVMAGHWLVPQLSIITMITISALLLPLLALLQRSGPAAAGRQYRRHIEQAVPGMAGELLLFLAAGVLTAGIAAWVDISDFSLRLAHFGALEAAALVAVSGLAAVIGIHPLITLSSTAGMLLPVADSPELLALACLMSWSLGVMVSPCSGMHLAMQGRFGVSGYRLMAWNWRFCLVLLALDCAMLALFEQLL